MNSVPYPGMANWPGMNQQHAIEFLAAKPVTPADVDSASSLNGDCDERRAGAQLVPKLGRCCRCAAKIPSAGQDTGNCNGGHHDR